MSKTLKAFAVLLVCATFGQAPSQAQTFALSDTKDLFLLNVKADAVQYKGRQAVRLTKDVENDGFALLRGADFQDGTVEADIALKITTQPGVRMPGFSGTWQVRCSSDAGMFDGVLQLKREGSTVAGIWSGALGNARPITGTWRAGYVELGFLAEWPSGQLGKSGSTTAILTGWIDGDAASGRMKVEGRADGRWTATRKP